MTPGPAHHTLPHPPREPCARSPGTLLNPATLKVYPAPCGRWTCPPCAEAKRQRWINELHGRAHPERFFTLTLAPRSARGVWLALKHFNQDVRRHGYAWQYFATIARNPRGTGAHVHGLQSGTYLPLKRLKIYAARNGFGEQAHIGAIAQIGGVAGYVTKHLVRRDLQIEPDLKGTRRIRYSRHFFHSPRKEVEEDWRFLRVPPDFAESLAAAIRANQAARIAAGDPPDVTRAAWLQLEYTDPRDVEHFDLVARALGADIPSWAIAGRAHHAKAWRYHDPRGDMRP